jgi:hypothetical protein
VASSFIVHFICKEYIINKDEKEWKMKGLKKVLELPPMASMINVKGEWEMSCQRKINQLEET